MRKNIGVLLPQSMQYPTMGKEFMSGLRLAAEQNRLEIDFKVEGIGFGENQKTVIDGIQKLVNQENVVLTTGIFGHKDFQKVSNFVSQMGEILIASDLGAVLPFGYQPQKGVFVNSLDLTNSAFHLANYLVKNGMNKIATSLSYYDSGYSFIHALEQGIYKSSSSEFVGHFITPLQPRENEAELMLDFVEKSNADALFCSYNGVCAKEHAHFLKENKVNQKIPLFTHTFAIGDDVLQENPELFIGTQVVSSWIIEFETEENKLFVENYQKEFGNLPSEFALLGYENGILISEFLNKPESLFSISRKGPRGSLKIDQATNRTVFKHFLWEMNYQNETYEKSKICELDTPTCDVIERAMNEQSSELGHRGWSNAYLCH